jgi:hypothetical protein
VLKDPSRKLSIQSYFPCSIFFVFYYSSYKSLRFVCEVEMMIRIHMGVGYRVAKQNLIQYPLQAMEESTAMSYLCLAKELSNQSVMKKGLIESYNYIRADKISDSTRFAIFRNVL